ncbi:MAG: hypothetical protein DMD57_09765 [Gemmatimonadetes bacterium]|nr:MAG: hypothetical protein DMD57_09765 [Gemmatimonadota bacterium]
MQLLRLRLVNFRQHADTELEFGPGIMGIIGPNGSGKTTILEAIAWALYGAQAVRGDKDSIRRLGAKGRAGVDVELEFRLGAHEYRVTRGLSTAALHQDGQVIANSLKAVTDKLERTLGMTHDEFFNTYFTGQKELAVMAALGKTERAGFLSRVLGYERLREAQERVREVRNAVAAEVRGLEAGLPDGAALAGARQAAEQRLTEARRSAKRVDAARRAAEAALGREEPRWNEWMARRERTLSLDGERRMAEQAVVASARPRGALEGGSRGARATAAGDGGAAHGRGAVGRAGPQHTDARASAHRARRRAGGRRPGGRGGAGTAGAARGGRGGREGGAHRVGAGPAVCRDEAHGAAQAVRRGQRAARPDRDAGPGGDVSHLQASARAGIRGCARAARCSARGDHGRREVFPAAARAARPATRQAARCRSRAGPRARGEPSRQCAGRRAAGAG